MCKVDHSTRETCLLFSKSSMGSFTSPLIWPMEGVWRRQGQHLKVTAQCCDPLNWDKILNQSQHGLTSFLNTLVVGSGGVFVARPIAYICLKGTMSCLLEVHPPIGETTGYWHITSGTFVWTGRVVIWKVPL